MCGIFGVVSKTNVVDKLVDGLLKLEYRGYDSAGLSVIDDQNNFSRVRSLGKVENLKNTLINQKISGNIGIAHTRWATHGKPSEKNAHPHLSGDIMIVHNGTVENSVEVRDYLINKGYTFDSETDTELVACLINDEIKHEQSLLKAIRQATARLTGSYSAAILYKPNKDTIWVIRKGGPIIIGGGEKENFISSDKISLFGLSNRFHYLEDGDIAEVSINNIKILDVDNQEVSREIKNEDSYSYEISDKNDHEYFMHKEIFEQPEVLQRIISSYIENDTIKFSGNIEQILHKINNIKIVACGSSYHAGIVACSWLESLSGVSCSVEIASEFSYRTSVTPENTLFISLSQSGETADVLSALQIAKKKNYIASLAICNVPWSSLVRESDYSIITQAGSEVGVASTKTFTSQMLTLLIFSIVLGKTKGVISQNKEKELVKHILDLPKQVEQTLSLEEDIINLSKDFVNKLQTVFLGRGLLFPIALEGALKLKELSYIYAEGFAAGEIKHGPIALIEEGVPVIILVKNNYLLNKLQLSAEEVLSRGAKVYICTDTVKEFSDIKGVEIIHLPFVEDIFSPIIYSVPIQLISYYISLFKGKDVDKPRNLAKSVTVE